jgi:hypothetical protein
MVHSHSILEFGASPDILNTTAIQSAIDRCHQQGGGQVYVPPGTFRTGTFWLKSNVHLYLEHGAVLKGSDDIEDFYPQGVKRGIIMAYEARNVTLSGRGTIDGNGTHFYVPDRRHSSQDIDRSLTRQGSDYLADTTGQPDGPIAYDRRPGMLVVFKSCENIKVKDVTLKDSAEWTLRFSESDRIWVEGVTIDNNLMIPNSDGVHLTTCTNAFISNAYISCGDDAIAVTGFNNATGATSVEAERLPSAQFGNRSGSCENIFVSDCVLRSRSACIRVGYGRAPIRHCTFHHIRMFDSNRGVGVFARDGAAIEHLRFSDIMMQTRLMGGWWGHGEPIHVSSIARNADRPGGLVRDVRFERIHAESEHGVVVYAEDKGAVQDVAFRDVALTISKGVETEAVGGNFDLRPTASPATNVFVHDIPGVHCGNVKNLSLCDFRLAWAPDLPGFFTHGVACVHADGVRIEGFEGSAARQSDDLELIHLRACDRVAIAHVRQRVPSDPI